MKIKMLSTRRGTEDGFKVQLFKEGGIYNIRDHLALAFLNAGACEIAKDAPAMRYDDYLYKNCQLEAQ